MINLSRANVFISVLVTVIGCGSGSVDIEGPEFARSFAFPDCAPWDGAAVSVYLTDSSYNSISAGVGAPFLHLAIWRGAAQLSGTTISWPNRESVGTASWCVTNADCESAPSGRIRVSSFVGDSIVSGDYDVRFAENKVMRGSFRARWVDRRMLCG